MRSRRAAAVILAAASLLLGLAIPAQAQVTPPGCTTVHHWGQFFGLLAGSGGGDQTQVPAVVTIPDSGGCVAETGTSNSTEYALMSDGTLWAWGQGQAGELGNGGTAANFTATAVQVQFPAGVMIASIPADANPYDSAVAIDTTGHLWGWGLNKGGELCDGTKTMRTRPEKLTAWPAPVTLTAGADEHMQAETASGLEACGQDTAGVLGDGFPGKSATTPVAVSVIGSADIAALTESQDDAGALLADGDWYDWGANTSGMIGNGTTAAQDIPSEVPLPSAAVQVSQGGSDPQNGQVLALLADGSLYAWGNDAWSQLGDGGTVNQLSPELIPLPPGVSFTQVDSGGQTSYGLTSGGGVYAWGDGSHWQSGTGSQAVQPVPVQVDSGATLISSTAYNVEVGTP